MRLVELPRRPRQGQQHPSRQPAVGGARSGCFSWADRQCRPAPRLAGRGRLSAAAIGHRCQRRRRRPAALAHRSASRQRRMSTRSEGRAFVQPGRSWLGKLGDPQPGNPADLRCADRHRNTGWDAFRSDRVGQLSAQPTRRRADRYSPVRSDDQHHTVPRQRADSAGGRLIHRCPISGRPKRARIRSAIPSPQPVRTPGLCTTRFAGHSRRSRFGALQWMGKLHHIVRTPQQA